MAVKSLLLPLLIQQCYAVDMGLPVQLQSSAFARHLSLELIAGYEPQTLVTDENALDKDQAAMEGQLALKTTISFTNAKIFYEEGGNSNSYALLNLATSLQADIPAGTVVSGFAQDETTWVGGLTTGEHKVGESLVKVEYQISEVQESYVGCRVGALPRISKADLTGCFTPRGNITIGTTSHNYDYNIRQGNKNGRTIQSLSLQANDEMMICENCPYRTFEKYYQYYGTPFFGDQWINAAFAMKSTAFTNGNANFAKYDFTARQQVIAQGTVLLIVYQYVIAQMEKALDACQSSKIPVHAWDLAVAYYTGSLEGDDGQGVGKLLHTMADNHCQNFKTCGENANAVHGHAKLNIDIFREFMKGQALLLDGKCNEARPIKERIEELMAVSLIQGALRFAYIRSEMEGDNTDQAEGATLAAAVLPLIRYCNTKYSDIIYNAMAVGSEKPDFSSVKSAFEGNYQCLGVTCADIGGLWDEGNQKYFDGAGPCSGSGGPSQKVGAIVGGTMGGFILALIGFLFLLRKRSAKKHVMAPPTNDRISPGYTTKVDDTNNENDDDDLQEESLIDVI